MANIDPQKQPVGGSYDIEAHNKANAPLFSVPLLRFYWRKLGKGMRIKKIEHPGVHPVGWVRRAVSNFDVNMRADLVKFRKGNLPTREQLVDIFNENLEKAHHDIVSGSPEWHFPENRNRYSVEHLKDSWDIVKAER